MVQVYRSELSYYVNGTEASLAARGSTSLHGSVSDADAQGTHHLRVGQTSDGNFRLFYQWRIQELVVGGDPSPPFQFQGRRQVKKCGVDTHGKRAERETITGVWGQSPSGVQGRAPGQGVRGKAP